MKIPSKFWFLQYIVVAGYAVLMMPRIPIRTRSWSDRATSSVSAYDHEGLKFESHNNTFPAKKIVRV